MEAIALAIAAGIFLAGPTIWEQVKRLIPKTPTKPDTPPVASDDRLRLLAYAMEIRDAVGDCGDCSASIDFEIIPAIMGHHNHEA